MVAPVMAPLPWPSVRVVAASAAVVVALGGRGDLLFLGGLLAVGLGERRSSIAAVLAMGAVAVRWGTTSMETIAGAVTILGPALRVGPPLAAVAVALAAVALLLAGLGRPRLARVAVGATAGAVVGGPVGASSAPAILIGVVAVAVGAALAAGLPRVVPTPSDRLRATAPAAAVVAIALAAIW